MFDPITLKLSVDPLILSALKETREIFEEGRCVPVLSR